MKYDRGGIGTKDKYRYNQHTKQNVRHISILKAVEALTLKREESCCVGRNYVRKIYDYFILPDDISENKKEAEKIDVSYITRWERLHDSFVGSKSPEDLTVCFLSGPEPNNDFQEFTNLGILPQNIWAFESNNQAYKKAIAAYSQGEFPQPKILKQNIETFFQQTPKKFDIIYIDACGSVPSSQHALRCVSSICQNHRLNSPGAIITNFAKPDITKEKIKDYFALVSQYMFFKEYPSIEIKFDDSGIKNEEYLDYLKKVENQFELYYGNFISALLRDIPAVIIPLERIAQNPYLNQLFDIADIDLNIKELLEMARGNSLAYYFFSVEFLLSRNILDEKSICFLKEIGNYSDLLKGLKIMVLLRNGKLKLKEDVEEIKNYFESNKNIYQFLDKPHSNLFFDIIINQLCEL